MTGGGGKGVRRAHTLTPCTTLRRRWYPSCFFINATARVWNGRASVSKATTLTLGEALSMSDDAWPALKPVSHTLTVAVPCSGRAIRISSRTMYSICCRYRKIPPEIFSFARSTPSFSKRLQTAHARQMAASMRRCSGSLGSVDREQAGLNEGERSDLGGGGLGWWWWWWCWGVEVWGVREMGGRSGDHLPWTAGRTRHPVAFSAREEPTSSGASIHSHMVCIIMLGRYTPTPIHDNLET